MTTKLYWKVAPKPRGRYRSFQRRGWPTAYYSGGDEPAAFLTCEDDYSPARVRTGQHSLITITVLHHNVPDVVTWKRYNLRHRAATLEEAKSLVQRFFDEHESWQPIRP